MTRVASRPLAAVGGPGDGQVESRGVVLVMRVALEVTSTVEGVLVGSASWAGCEEPVDFHGTLELVALLVAAADLPAATCQSRRHAAD